MHLSTGQKPHDTLKIGELFMEIEDDVSEKVEAVTEEAFKGSLESFLKRIGWC